MGLDFNESDILKDILNFKIVNRKKLEEKYGFKIIDRMIKHINEFLCKNDNGIIHKSKNYLYYFGKGYKYENVIQAGTYHTYLAAWEGKAEYLQIQ